MRPNFLCQVLLPFGLLRLLEIAPRLLLCQLFRSRAHLRLQRSNLRRYCTVPRRLLCELLPQRCMLRLCLISRLLRQERSLRHVQGSTLASRDLLLRCCDFGS